MPLVLANLASKSLLQAIMIWPPTMGAMTPFIFGIGVSMILDVTFSESVVGCPLQIVVDKSLQTSLTQRFQGSGYVPS